MKHLSFPLVALLLGSGCAGGTIAPGDLPKGATSGVFTVAESSSVASCIATALDSTVQPVGDRLVISSVRYSGVSYSVGPNTSGSVYPTQIAITGESGDTEEARSVSACIDAGTPARR